MEETELQVETLNPVPADAQSQPAFQPEPKLTEQEVRAAVARAEATGEDPTRLKIGDVGHAPMEVPEKFKKPNGEVDVEKLNASTKQLDEATQQKEQKLQEVQKTVEDYLRNYKEKERKFNSLPNPQKLAAQLPTPPPPIPDNPAAIPDNQLREMLMRDMQADPLTTTLQLIELSVQRRLQERFAPLEEERKDNQVRENIKALAARDSRVLQPEVFAAINAKLEADPDLWKLKNPHKAAWLEVREELRLGEPSQVQAQPSKPASPILGGGTPPPAPSSSEGQVSAQTLAAAIEMAALKDPRDQKKVDPQQQANLDRAAKEYFDRAFRR